MAEMWKSQSVTVYLDWIQAILDESSDELNEWEANFISSLGVRLLNGQYLTQTQAEKLEQIYASKTK